MAVRTLRIHPLTRLALTCGVALWLGACAQTPTASKDDMKTVSDQSDVERRAQTRLQLAGAYLADGKRDIALDEIKKTINIDPNFSPAYNLRGLIYAALGQSDLAEASFQRAIALDGQNGDNLHNYGWFLCQAKRYDEAQANFSRALEQRSYRSAIKTMLAQGICQAQAGDLKAAKATLANAYQFDTVNPMVGLNYAEVLHRLGDNDHARFYINRVNSAQASVSSASLWLSVRVERALGNELNASASEQLLVHKFPKSPEAALVSAAARTTASR